MGIDTQERASRVVIPEEALIEEARRHRRDRWKSLITIFSGVVALVVISVFVFSRQTVSHPTGARSVSTPAAISTHNVVVPRQPGPLAILPSGGLVISDASLNEVLVRLRGGGFRVLAGDGKRGFSGDGGMAQKASLNRPEGLAVGRHGTIYVADSGNGRIRAISPVGVIRTIAGNGNAPARHNTIVIGASATTTAIGHPVAVATGPKGSVYFAASHSVFKLTTGGKLQLVVGPNTLDRLTPAFPIVEACMPVSLAVSSNDNLYINCSNPYAIVEMMANGHFQYLGSVRPHDAFATLVRSSTGGVMAVNGASIIHFDSSGHQLVANFLSFRLPNGKLFWPQGIAQGRDGSLYLDQGGTAGIGPPAIVKRTAVGTMEVLWNSI